MENARGRLSNRVQRSTICCVFLRLSLDREKQFRAVFALLVVAMQKQRRRAGNVLLGLSAAFALRIALRNTFPPSDWLCKPILGILICFPTLFRRDLRCFPIAPTVVANEEQIWTLSAHFRS